MSSYAVLSSQYLHKKIQKTYPSLPENTENIDRMHEFIITLPQKCYEEISSIGIAKSQIISKVGKLFLDFGLHAPTVSFPEQYGLMIEPTESYNKDELDRFSEVLNEIFNLLTQNPEVLLTTPHFCPIKKVDEVSANKNLILSEPLGDLPNIRQNPISPKTLNSLPLKEVSKKILEAHKNFKH